MTTPLLAETVPEEAASGDAALPLVFFERPAPTVAAALIGAGLWFEGVGGAIVETEAYTAGDPASHSFNGPTPRNRAMFGPVAHAYVYRSYGVHWCFNIVCGSPGSAVLVRALAPQAGLDRMRERRGRDPVRDLCRGPGRLCQALGITAAQDGLSLRHSPLVVTPPPHRVSIVAGPRIGITKGVKTPWRFGLVGSAFLSRSFRD